MLLWAGKHRVHFPHGNSKEYTIRQSVKRGCQNYERCSHRMPHFWLLFLYRKVFLETMLPGPSTQAPGADLSRILQQGSCPLSEIASVPKEGGWL